MVPSPGVRSLVPAKLLLQVSELRLHCRLVPGALGARLHQIALAVERRVRHRPGLRLRDPALLRFTQLGRHFRHLALGHGDFVLLHRELPLEHAHTLAMLRREALGHCNRLGVGNLRRQAAATLRVLQLPPLRRELALAPGDAVAHLADRRASVDDGITQAGGEGASVGARALFGKDPVQSRAKTLEHAG